MTDRGEDRLTDELLSGLDALDAARRKLSSGPVLSEVGTVSAVARGVATAVGLPGIAAGETVTLGRFALGLVSDVREDAVGVVLLSGSQAVRAGDRVRRTGRVLEVPVGDGLLGRVIDPLGNPLDGGGEVSTHERLPVERAATPIVDRAAVTEPLQTGVKVVDTLFPIGRGQRELIVGDRQTGKTAIALTAILAQRSTGVLCVYCAVGKRGAEVARTVEDLRRGGALPYSTVVMAPAESEPGLKQVAPFAAMSIAESWMEAGRDVLVVFDDLVQHARAHREVSLLLRRPPGREAYPGDIFYLHSRLLERATQLSEARGGGSLTALPIVETQERDLAAYVPTNLISITDGQIVLAAELFRRGQLPAVDVGLSVSRVGGKAQRPAYRAVAGGLRLDYAQFEELERFARLGAELDASTSGTLVRGERVREVLNQGDLEVVPVGEQIAVLLATSEGLFDGVPVDHVAELERAVRRQVASSLPEVSARVERGEPFTEEDREALLGVVRAVLASAPGALR